MKPRASRPRAEFSLPLSSFSSLSEKRAVAMRRRAFHSGRKKMTAVTKILLAGAMLAVSCATLPAQQAQTQRLRGTIEKVEGNVLTLKPATGDNVTLTLVG